MIEYQAIDPWTYYLSSITQPWTSESLEHDGVYLPLSAAWEVVQVSDLDDHAQGLRVVPLGQSYSQKDSKCLETVSQDHSHISLERSFEEEVRMHAPNQASWYLGGFKKMTFHASEGDTNESPPSSSGRFANCKAWFDEEKGEALCISFGHELLVYLDSGEVHTLPVVSWNQYNAIGKLSITRIIGLFPLVHGIVVECECALPWNDPEGLSVSQSSDAKIPSLGQAEAFECSRIHFYINHPLNSPQLLTTIHSHNELRYALKELNLLVAMDVLSRQFKVFQIAFERSYPRRPSVALIYSSDSIHSTISSTETSCCVSHSAKGEFLVHMLYENCLHTLDVFHDGGFRSDESKRNGKTATNFRTLRLVKRTSCVLNIQSCCALYASRSTLLDLLLLHTDGGLALYIGDVEVIRRISIRPELELAGVNVRGYFRDAVRSCVSLVISPRSAGNDKGPGCKIYRLDLGDIRPVSALVESLLSTIDYAGHDKAGVEIRKHFMEQKQEMEESNHTEQIADIEWAAFRIALSHSMENARSSDESCLTILYCLHLELENTRISRMARKEKSKLLRLCWELAGKLSALEYRDYYAANYSDSAGSWDQVTSPSSSSSIRVPDFFQWVRSCLRIVPAGNEQSVSRNPVYFPTTIRLDEVFQSARVVGYRFGCRLTMERLAQVIFELGKLARQDGSTIANKMLSKMVQFGFSLEEIRSLELPIAVILEDILWICRHNPSMEWSKQACVLVGREDYVSPQESEGSNPEAQGSWGSLAGTGKYSLSKLHILSLKNRADSMHRVALPTKRLQEVDSANSYDGCEYDPEFFSIRFGKDNRLADLVQMLQCSKPVTFRYKATPNDPEQSRTISQQNQLLPLLRRQLSSPIGRGAFTMGLYRASDPVEPFRIPQLCLAGIIPGRRAVLIQLDQAPLPPNFLDWVEFHNGVAAGLRIGSSHHLTLNVSRSWIVNNRPKSGARDGRSNAAHAGMLLALGLGDHLPALKMTDWYEYFMRQHDLTSIALMLGISSRRCGTMDSTVAKLLCIHIPYFNEGGFAQSDWHISSSVQAAACASLGLLFQGTCNRFMMEGLLYEMTRRFEPGESPGARDCCVLSCGFAIGLICLGLGLDPQGVSDLLMVRRLALMANGGRWDSLPQLPKNESLRPEAENASLKIYDTGLVPIDTTSPAALLALTLMCLKCEDDQLEKLVPIPNSNWEFDRVRPDHLLLRVLALKLNMWSQIEPTKLWLQSCVTPFLASPIADSDAFDLYNVQHRPDPREGQASGGADEDPSIQGPDEDSGVLAALRLARAYAFTGGAVALALKYAGTHNKACLDIFIEILNHLEDIHAKRPNPAFRICIDSVCLSIGILMSGSGNVECLRIFRAVRLRDVNSKSFGSHMAVHMAMGFLFLGGGTWAFSSSKESIAYLLLSIYYRFPSSSTDNHYHLQAYRHLYVLACEPRCLDAYEVGTHQSRIVPVQVELYPSPDFNAGVLELATPCILPPLHLLKRVRVKSPRYWPLEARLERVTDRGKVGFGSLGDSIDMNGIDQGGIDLLIKGFEDQDKDRRIPAIILNRSTGRYQIFVKRKSGFLGYADDADGRRSRFLLSGHALEEGDAERSIESTLSLFSKEPHVSVYAKYLGDDTSCKSIMLRRLRESKPDIIPYEVELARLIKNVRCRNLELSSVIESAMSLAHVVCYFQSPAFTMLHDQWAGLIDSEKTLLASESLNQFLSENQRRKDPSLDRLLANLMSLVYNLEDPPNTLSTREDSIPIPELAEWSAQVPMSSLISFLNHL